MSRNRILLPSLIAVIAAASTLTAALTFSVAGPAHAATLPRPDHVVVVIFENTNASSIRGNADAPYFNQLADGGAYFSSSYAVTHPSQPNYLALFSGSTQGVTDDTCPAPGAPYSTGNLGSQLISAGFSFKAYSEDYSTANPAACSVNGPTGSDYQRKHAPWSDWTQTADAAHHVPFSDFPTDFSTLPTVSFVVPNMCDDMHDCSTQTGDAWLKNKLGGYATWAKTHNSLLVTTFDEDDFTDVNQIYTSFYGANVVPGSYAEGSAGINHYNVLATIEDMYGLPRLGNAVGKAAITDVWGSGTPTTTTLTNGVPVTGQSAATGANLTYKLDVPAGASNLSFTTSGGTGDADLYVKSGTAPTTSSYDCRPYVDGNAETCSFSTPAAGTYYVMLNAYAAFSGVTLTGSYAAGSSLNGVHTVVASGKALDDPGSSTATGTQMITWTPNGGTNQQWRFAQQTDGSYTLTNVGSGLCLDVNGASTAAGAKIIQWTCNGGSNQKWNAARQSDGTYKITSVRSGLSLTTASATNNALVTQQTDTGTALQRWAVS